jgi:hypothetical protein
MQINDPTLSDAVNLADSIVKDKGLKVESTAMGWPPL